MTIDPPALPKPELESWYGPSSEFNQEPMFSADQMREYYGLAATELEELRRENDLLRQHAADKISHTTLMTDLNVNSGGMNMGLQGGAAQLMAESFAEQFKDSGAPNYMEITFTSAEKMPGVRFVVTVQRADGETPTQQIKKLKAELAAMPCAAVAPAAGYAMLPLHPTPEMSAAGFCVEEAEHDPAGVYLAMVAVAPRQPVAPLLTDAEIAAAVRPLYADDTAAAMGLADDIRTVRAVLPATDKDSLTVDPDAARDFPHNTCAASRHVQMIAEALRDGETCHMLADDPKHCAESMLSVVESLYKARTALAGLAAASSAVCQHWWHGDAGSNTVKLDELIGKLDAALKAVTLPTLILYEHEDGRYGVATEGNARFADGDPGWHRLGPASEVGTIAPLTLKESTP